MFSSPTTRQPRPAFSIIEVLTSIVVAMIGVFGVMILIPFAIRQAQTGLDSDAATIVARNAFAQFEIAGFRNPDRWIVDDGSGTSTTTFATNFPGEAFSIDPLGITENGMAPNYDYEATRFPFRNPPGTLPDNLFLKPANLLLPGTPVAAFTTADARKMFRSSDELVFGEAVAGGGLEADLNPPTQIYDVANGNAQRRQSTGSFSWSAIVVPQGNKYRMFILVYKDRLTSLALTDPEYQMISAAVENPAPLMQSPLSTVTLEAGFSIPNNEVRRGDWVMLVNKVDPFPQQMGFYRVVNYDGEDPVEMTLDGPDFLFDATAVTHMVHLKNVVGVYERTFTPEQQSNWTLSN